MLTHLLIGLLTLGVASNSGSPVASPAAAVSAGSPVAQEAMVGSDLLERDARLRFPNTVRVTALEVLEREPKAPKAERSLALFALGASDAKGSFDILSEALVSASPLERQSAAYGLAALGSIESREVAALAQSAPAGGFGGEVALATELAQACLVGLFASGREDAKVLARGIAQVQHPLSDLGSALLAFEANPNGAAPHPAIVAYFQVRWEAARRFGLVDGRSWSAWLLEQLKESDDFLDALVFRGAARLRRPGVADHYLEALLNGTGAQRVRGAVLNMPSELNRIIDSGFWRPANKEEWSSLVQEIENARLEGELIATLSLLRLRPNYGSQAARLLVRAGSSKGLPIVELELSDPDPERRALVCQTLGDSGLRRYGFTLEPLLSDSDPRVRAAALVAQERLGVVTAGPLLSKALEKDNEDFVPTVQAMCLAASDPTIQARLLDTYGRLEPPYSLEVAVELALAGRLGAPRWQIRDTLAMGAAAQLSERKAATMVRALGIGADQAELTTLRGLFPRQGGLELNIELALALLNNRDLGMLPFLREAMWREPWNRSVLAAALIMELDGVDALRAELQRPPEGSDRADLRRVGFALGQWGGLEEVERLSRRLQPGDPALQGALLGALAARTF